MKVKSAMPQEEPPRSGREDVQLVLGQIHGVIHVAVTNVDAWLPSDDGKGVAAEDIQEAYAEIAERFGLVQAALSTGEYDAALEKVGLANAQMKPKKKGLWGEIAGFFDKTGKRASHFVERMRGALGWGNTILGSIVNGLKKDIEHIPGAGAAAESIREFVEVLLNASEHTQSREKN
jgi:hypothetical protein